MVCQVLNLGIRDATSRHLTLHASREVTSREVTGHVYKYGNCPYTPLV